MDVTVWGVTEHVPQGWKVEHDPFYCPICGVDEAGYVFYEPDGSMAYAVTGVHVHINPGASAMPRKGYVGLGGWWHYLKHPFEMDPELAAINIDAYFFAAFGALYIGAIELGGTAIDRGIDAPGPTSCPRRPKAQVCPSQEFLLNPVSTASSRRTTCPRRPKTRLVRRL